MNAIILAAGLGTRLRPLTDNMPKALVKVGEHSLLEHLIRKLRKEGFTDIVVNVHHFAEMIIKFLADNHNFGMNIKVSDERNLLLDTGGGVAKALNCFDYLDSPVLVHNVDIVSDYSLSGLISDCLGDTDVLMSVQRRNSSRMLYFDRDMLLKGWKNEKTGETMSGFANFNPDNFSPYAFTGIHVIGAEMALAMRDEKDKFPLIPFYLNAASKYVIKGKTMPNGIRWVDAGKPEALPLALEIFNN